MVDGNSLPSSSSNLVDGNSLNSNSSRRSSGSFKRRSKFADFSTLLKDANDKIVRFYTKLIHNNNSSSSNLLRDLCLVNSSSSSHNNTIKCSKIIISTINNSKNSLFQRSFFRNQWY
jgi:hypothetical protein